MFENSSDIMKMDPVAAVEYIKGSHYDPDSFGSLDAYMEWLVGSVWRFQGIGLNPTGETLEARCESLISQLVAQGLLQK